MAAWSRSATPPFSGFRLTRQRCSSCGAPGNSAAAIAAVLFSTACGALFGLLALRASGIGFLMITLALGQIVWGIAYRANTLTNGDNGLRFPARPQPFGIDITGAPSFYWFTLIVFAIALFVHLAPHRLTVRRGAAGRARPAAPHAHARP